MYISPQANSVRQNKTVLGNLSRKLNSSSAKLAQNSACEILGPRMYLIFERSILSPMTVMSFIDNLSITQSAVCFVAVAVSAKICTDLGKMLLKVPISEKAFRNASPLL